MSKTIETIIAHRAPAQSRAKQARADLAGNWQIGLESGTQVQRKLRLTLTNAVARQPA
jgi:hypothetical protein